MNVVVAGRKAVPPGERRLIAKAAKAALGTSARRRGELCVILVTDPEIRRINKKFLGHDYVTDVIAFPYENHGSSPADTFPSPRGRESEFGDVYIAVGIAKRQAKELGHDLLTELLTLAVHGTLHLVGYDDHKPADKKRMFKRQDAIVRRLLKVHGKG